MFWLHKSYKSSSISRRRIPWNVKFKNIKLISLCFLFLLKVSAALYALWYAQTFFVWGKWMWGVMWKWVCHPALLVGWFLGPVLAAAVCSTIIEAENSLLLFKRVIFLILPSKMLTVCFIEVDRPGNTQNYWWCNAGFFITSHKKGKTSTHRVFLHFYVVSLAIDEHWWETTMRIYFCL